MNEKTVVLGDAHGDLSYILQAAARAQRLGIRTMLQLGDLAMYWPGSDHWLVKLDRVLARFEIEEFLFIAGNHEGWESKVGPGGLLGARQYGERDGEGLIITSKRTKWADNGQRWERNGVQFGALGGAFSTDHEDRRAGKNWWPDLEEPTSDDVERLGDDHLDVLVTHDAPHVPPGVPPRGHSEADREHSGRARRLIRRAIDATEPELLLHGHWHHRYSLRLNWEDATEYDTITHVEGLGANITSLDDAVVVLDLNTLTLEPSQRDGQQHDYRCVP